MTEPATFEHEGRKIAIENLRSGERIEEPAAKPEPPIAWGKPWGSCDPASGRFAFCGFHWFTCCFEYVREHGWPCRDDVRKTAYAAWLAEQQQAEAAATSPVVEAGRAEGEFEAYADARECPFCRKIPKTTTGAGASFDFLVGLNAEFDEYAATPRTDIFRAWTETANRRKRAMKKTIKVLGLATVAIAALMPAWLKTLLWAGSIYGGARIGSEYAALDWAGWAAHGASVAGVLASMLLVRGAARKVRKLWRK